MLLELDDEFADEIVRQGLIDSYFMIKHDQKRVKNGGYMHPDDIAMSERVLAAIEVLGGWYFSDFEQAKKEYKKKRKL
jgi:hypothetical protein